MFKNSSCLASGKQWSQDWHLRPPACQALALMHNPARASGSGLRWPHGSQILGPGDSHWEILCSFMLTSSHPNAGRSASPTTGKVCEAKDCVRRVFGEEVESQNYAS